MNYIDETQLVPELFRWLRRSRRIANSSAVVQELPWFQRRIDIAVETASGLLLSFELKLRHNTRAIEQATYNRAVFDRSYIVTATEPTLGTTRQAQRTGVGVLLATEGAIRLLLDSPLQRNHWPIRNRLRQEIRERANISAHV